MPDSAFGTSRRALAVLLRRLVVNFGLLLMAGFAATALVKIAPGFGIDERALNVAYGSFEQDRALEDPGVISSYTRFLRGAVTGDFGESSAFGEPVRALLAARVWVTVNSTISGFATAWGIALLVCVLGQLPAGRWLRIAGNAVAAAVVCVPSAIIAFSCVALGLTVGAGIGIVVFPRVLRYSDNLLSRAMEEPFAVSARSRGASEIRVVLNHALRATAPQLVTLAGVTFTVAFGAAIPMEVLADSAGLGQLAWRGALARDLALVVSVTLVIGSVTLLANTAARSVADLMTEVGRL